MIRSRVLRIAGLWLLFGSLGACDLLGPDGPSGPGDFHVTLISPNGTEGSVVLELTGGVDLGTVSPVDGEVLYQHSAGATRIVVVLDEPGQIRFSVRTEDVGRVPDAAVIQVADGQNALRPSVSGYRVTFTRTEDSSKKGRGPGA